MVLGNESQEKLLDEAMGVVRAQAFQMKRCLEKSRLMDGLKHASNMLAELRTSSLTPKMYYELYMFICDELRHLELYLLDEFQNGHKVTDLYELVQYAGNIVPRLYLLITVGMVYIKSNENCKKDILRDLVEMCRGVQHPLRGLFLRNYLLQCTRNILPDTEECEEKVDATTQEQIRPGNINDSIEFILTNFAEMNKLWVRMQHQGHSRDKDKKDRERRELRILVGTNLVRLSELECIHVDRYKKVVLPGILEQIVSCRDPLSQEYLMECIIQVFPDEFHLETLSSFLKACAELHSEVNVKNIIISLIDRLAIFASKDEGNEAVKGAKLFYVFSEHIAKVVQSHPDMPLEDVISLHVSLVNLAQKCAPDRIDYVDIVFKLSIDALGRFSIKKIHSACALGKEITRLLRVPCDNYSDILILLQLSNFCTLLQVLDYDGRKNMATFLINNAVENDTKIKSEDQAEGLLDLIACLLEDQTDEPTNQDYEDHVSEQESVAKFLHLFDPESLDAEFSMVSSAQKRISKGGSKRIAHTLPTLIFNAYKLAFKYYDDRNNDEKWMEKVSKVFQFCHESILMLVKCEFFEMSLRLFVKGCLTIDTIPFDNHETVAYEFMSQAFSIYEDEISESRAQMSAISLIMSAVEKTTCFTAENHEPLRSQCALAASRLLKKPDQSRAVALSSHIFWSGREKRGKESVQLRDEKKVLDCLKKSLRIANQCMDVSVKVQLYIEALNSHIYHYEEGNSMITSDHLMELLSKIREDLPKLEINDDFKQIENHLNNTLIHLKLKKDDYIKKDPDFEKLNLNLHPN